MNTITLQRNDEKLRFIDSSEVRCLMALVLFTSISACTSSKYDPLEESFGNSLHRMIEAQTVHTEPATDQEANQSLRGLNGKLSEQIFKEYRQTTGKQEAVKSSESLELKID